MIRRLAVAWLLAGASAAMAQGGLPTVTVGPIASQKACTLYQQSAGKAELSLSRDALRASASWRTWMVRDCVDKFESIRQSLEAALAASGKVAVVPAGGRYLLTGRISDASGGGPAPEAPDVGNGYSISTSDMAVDMDLSLREATGRTVFGALYTTRLQTGSDIKVGTFRTTSSRGGEETYTALQHAVALRAARQVAFRLAPLRVIGGDGREIRLNYGAPLLELGTILQVTSPDGGVMTRYVIRAAGSGSALAEIDGDGDWRRIVPGSLATVIEADDAAANARRFRKVELP